MPSQSHNQPMTARQAACLNSAEPATEAQVLSVQVVSSQASVTDHSSVGDCVEPTTGVSEAQETKAMIAELSQCEYASLSGKDRLDVESMFKALTAKYPGWHHARYCFGLHYLAFHPAKAAAQLVEAEKLAPTDLQTQMALVQAYMKLHHYGLAGSVVARARKLNPEHRLLAQLASDIERKSTDVF